MGHTTTWSCDQCGAREGNPEFPSLWFGVSIATGTGGLYLRCFRRKSFCSRQCLERGIEALVSETLDEMAENTGSKISTHPTTCKKEVAYG